MNDDEHRRGGYYKTHRRSGLISDDAREDEIPEDMRARLEMRMLRVLVETFAKELETTNVVLVVGQPHVHRPMQNTVGLLYDKSLSPDAQALQMTDYLAHSIGSLVRVHPHLWGPVLDRIGLHVLRPVSGAALSHPPRTRGGG